MAKSEVSNRIRRLRFDRNEMTQQELADLVGVTRQTIISLEKRRYSPSLPLAFRLALALGVSIDAIFAYEGQPLSTPAVDNEPEPNT